MTSKSNNLISKIIGKDHFYERLTK